MTPAEKEALRALLIAARTAALEAEFTEDFVEALTEEAIRDLQLKFDFEVSERKDLLLDPDTLNELVRDLAEMELETMEPDIREEAFNRATKKAATRAKDIAEMAERDLCELSAPIRGERALTVFSGFFEEAMKKVHTRQVTAKYTDLFEHYYLKEFSQQYGDAWSVDEIEEKAKAAAVAKASSLQANIANRVAVLVEEGIDYLLKGRRARAPDDEDEI